MVTVYYVKKYYYSDSWYNITGQHKYQFIHTMNV